MSKRLGLEPLSFNSVRDIWRYQLEGTGVTAEDFLATGMVQLAEKPLCRNMKELKFNTPSSKIDLIAEKLKQQGLSSLKPYKPPVFPAEGKFCLTFGRCPVHTQGRTANNPMLSELMPENPLRLNRSAAEAMKIADGDLVEVSNGVNTGTIKAKVTELIHPDAVFLVHGFGHELPVESRALGKGIADNAFMPEGLDLWNPAGGAMAMQEHFVSVRKTSP